ncbi:reverse transcriptase [Senna tora]|uniref:Reverse transcriptase n=1 Tax=Senna tora TaxID=362788 RepID=A0A834TEB1_9FABA|nr:reverse transcriptase [Senna tora]
MERGCNHLSILSEPNFLNWIQLNSKRKYVSSPLNIPNGTLFIYLIWQIWTARNTKVFDDTDCPPKIIAQNALAKVVEFIHLSKNGAMNNNSINVELGWTPPPENWFKPNVDGSYMENSGVMAAAGVIRNHMRHWVSGLSKFIGPGFLSSSLPNSKIVEQYPNHSHLNERCKESSEVEATGKKILDRSVIDSAKDNRNLLLQLDHGKQSGVDWYAKGGPLAQEHVFVEDSCRLQDIDDDGFMVTNCALLDRNDYDHLVCIACDSGTPLGSIKRAELEKQEIQLPS